MLIYYLRRLYNRSEGIIGSLSKSRGSYYENEWALLHNVLTTACVGQARTAPTLCSSGNSNCRYIEYGSWFQLHSEISGGPNDLTMDKIKCPYFHSTGHLRQRGGGGIMLKSLLLIYPIPHYCTKNVWVQNYSAGLGARIVWPILNIGWFCNPGNVT